MTPDRLPPHSIEAEQGVLGCVLLDPTGNIDGCREQGVEAEWFYDLRHRALWGHLVAMHDAGSAIDLITLGQRLKDAQQFEGIGGLAYLTELQDAVPSAANLAYYLGIIREKHRLRTLAATAAAILERVHAAGDANADAMIDNAEREILAVRGNGAKREVDGHGLALASVNALQARVEGTDCAVETGFRDLDTALTGGLRPGRVYVVAARPGLGKSALACGIAIHAASEGVPVGIFSLEMQAEEYAERLLAALSGVPVGSFRKGRVPSQQQQQRIIVGQAALRKLPLVVDDTPGLTAGQFRAIARRWKSRRGVGLLVVDYLQLLEPDKGGPRDRQEQVATMSRAMKLCAKELDLPVVLLCQLNRELEKDKARKPRLSDLRESGAIEQDADAVLMLYDPKLGERGEFDDPEDDSKPREVRLHVAKQRAGPKGQDVRLMFDGGLTRFTSASRIDRDAV